MNYLEWSHEYEKTAEEMNMMMLRLKQKRMNGSKTGKKELADKIIYYRNRRNECLRIARHLSERHRGVA